MNLVATEEVLDEPEASRFRLVRRKPDGTLQRGGLELLEGEGLVWVDLAGPRETDLALLAGRFGFHPLAIEDCLHLDQRPKLEEYGDHLFLVQHAFRAAEDPCELALHELHAFLGREYLVTVHADALPQVDAVFERAAVDRRTSERGSDFLLYLVSDRLADSHFALLDDLALAIEELEDAILAGPRRQDVERVFALKRTLVALRRTLSPAREAIGLLTRRGDPRIGERTALYFRDVYDHLVRVNESIEAQRDLLGNALDAYLSVLANRTNEIMKRLTIFSATFLPLTFITGFFGQNFTSIIPYERPWAFALMLALCALVPGAMLVWFMRKRWL